VVCGWCGRTKQCDGSWRAQGVGIGNVSHGICPECHAKELAKIKQKREAKMSEDVYRQLYAESIARETKAAVRSGRLIGALRIIIGGYNNIDPKDVARRTLIEAGYMCPQCEGDLLGGHCTACEQRGQ
jgi:hypothetical protein